MVVQLSQQDINDLKKQGYSEDEISKAVQEVEKDDLNTGTQQRIDPRTKSQTSAFSSGKMDDMARFQLELNDLLEQTEHILKGDIVEWVDGQKIWSANPHPEKNPLNSEGIRKIMLELQTYINRHIILGDYEENDINKILKDYSKKVADLIYMKYDELGMDNDDKRQDYASIVMNLVNLVYASYSRAKDGGERRSLREMISIQQSHQSQGTGMPQMMNNGGSKARGVLNPLRYIQGKYA